MTGDLTFGCMLNSSFVCHFDLSLLIRLFLGLPDFTPPRRCGDVIDFISSSTKTFLPLSPAPRTRRTSSPRLSHIRATTSPYTSMPIAPAALRVRKSSGNRSCAIATRFNPVVAETCILAPSSARFAKFAIAPNVTSTSENFAGPLTTSSVPIITTGPIGLAASNKKLNWSTSVGRSIPSRAVPSTARSSILGDKHTNQASMGLTKKTTTLTAGTATMIGSGDSSCKVSAVARKRVSSAVRRDSFGWKRKKGSENIEHPLPVVVAGGREKLDQVSCGAGGDSDVRLQAQAWSTEGTDKENQSFHGSSCLRGQGQSLPLYVSFDFSFKLMT